MAAQRALTAVSSLLKQLPMDAASPYTSAKPVADLEEAQPVASSAAVLASPPPKATVPLRDPVAERRQQLIDIEIAARGKPFETLAEKLEAEDRVDALQMSIEQTLAVAPPTAPGLLSLRELTARLEQLAKASALLNAADKKSE